MSDAPVTFEISRNQALRRVLIPMVFVWLLALAGAGGFGIYTWTGLAETHLIRLDVFVLLILAAMLCVFIPFLFNIVLILRKTAYKVRISDEEIVVNTFGRELKLKWVEVAEVRRSNWMFKHLLYITTRDGNLIQLSLLNNLDTIATQIQSRTR